MGKIAGKRREMRKSVEKWRTWRKKGGEVRDGEGEESGTGDVGEGEEELRLLLLKL